MSGKSRSGELYYYYACANKRAKRTSCSISPLNRDDLEQAVYNCAREVLLHEENIKLIAEQAEAVAEAQVDNELAEMKAERSRVKKSIANYAAAIANAGVRSIQLHTGGMCHLDAEMTRQGLEGLGPQDVDLVVLENVGNLVCPAEFDTGAVKNAMILSVPEGDDKPLKYPLMFQVCDVVLINKIDVLPYFDFDMDKCREYIAMRNPNAKVIPICAKTGEGIAEWTDWLREQVKAWQA